MTHPLASTDYGRWAEALDELLYQRTGLALIYWPSAPLASWWEEGLKASAACDLILAANLPAPLAQPQPPTRSDAGMDAFDQMQEVILWPTFDY
jgi:hypothetical protein